MSNKSCDFPFKCDFVIFVLVCHRILGSLCSSEARRKDALIVFCL